MRAPAAGDRPARASRSARKGTTERWTRRRSRRRSPRGRPTRPRSSTCATRPGGSGPDGKPAVSRRARIWEDVPDEKWNDWRWQLSKRLNTLEELEQVLNLTDDEREGLSAPDKFRVDITPVLRLAHRPRRSRRPDPAPGDPGRLRAAGLHRDDGGLARRGPPLAGAGPRPPLPGPGPDAHHDPVRQLLPLLHAEPDRRRPDPELQPPRARGAARLHPPHAADPRRPDLRRRRPHAGARSSSSRALRGLREIPHVEIIRIGSRVPVFMPQRDRRRALRDAGEVPPDVAEHPRQPPERDDAGARPGLRQAQPGRRSPWATSRCSSPGVNDCVHIQRDLVQKLVEIRVRPYYIYQCDLVEGAGHFRTPVGKGLEIIEGLRGHTSGLRGPAVHRRRARRRREDPGHAELPRSRTRTTRSCSATTRATSRPTRSRPATRPTTGPTCRWCQNPRPEPGQEGITGAPRRQEDVDRAGRVRRDARPRQRGGAPPPGSRRSGCPTASARSRARPASRCRSSTPASAGTASAAAGVRARRGAAPGRGPADRHRQPRAAVGAGSLPGASVTAPGPQRRPPCPSPRSATWPRRPPSRSA